MRPSAGDAPFDDPAYLFEPWWPGIRLLLVCEPGSVSAVADELADPLAAFPELAGIAVDVEATSAVLDGWLLVIDEETRRPDTALLRARLRDPRLRDGCAAFVAADLLSLDGRRLTRRPFRARRSLVESVVRSTDRCAVSRGLPGEGHALAAAVAPLGFTAISARRLDAPYRAGPAGDAWLRLPLAASEAEERPLPSLLVFSRLPLG